MGAINGLSQSPFLRGEFPNPLRGPHLSWMSSLSELMTGGTGSGLIYSGALQVGGYKAIGGLVSCWLSLPVGAHSITLPDYINPGPCIFSDGQIKWPSTNNVITITTAIPLSGWCTFRG